ncbi:MAG: diacylglycerol kinase family lipid kinase [Bacteroidales bacterium]|nr:diacylglycerol kinase family lipid kinase [Bacteroidales bacterium]
MDRCSRWTVIVNPHAGSGRTLPIWRKAKSLLEQRGVDFEELFTRGERDAQTLVCEAAGKGSRRFLAVGGDGTAHEVLEGIVSAVQQKGGGCLSDYTLGVIPIGSGNDWVKGHHSPRKLEKLVALIAAERFGTQDVVKVTAAEGESYMLNVGGIGFDAMVCQRVNEHKKRGKSGKLLYVNALFYQIFHYKPAPVRVLADGKEVFSGPFYSIAFAIGPYCGGGMRQCPAAVFDDGLLEMTLVPRLPLWKLLPKMPRLFDGTVQKAGDLLFERARSYEVSVLEGPQEIIEADGEIVGHTALRLEVLPERLNVLSNL